MANRWCDGFGRYGGTKSYMLNGSSGQAWAQISDGFSLSNLNPRTGLWHLRSSDGSGDQFARRVFGAALVEVYVAMAFYCNVLPSIEPTRAPVGTGGGSEGVFLCDFQDQANQNQISVCLGTDGALFVLRGTTVLGRSEPIIGAGAYQHIEIYAKADNSGGAVEIRVDEVVRLNLTGIDTVQTANIEFSQFRISRSDGQALVMDFADCYCNDTVADGSGCDSWLGDCKSGVAMVDADTAQADFALSAGSTGYSLLRGTPPDDATYLSTSSSTAESDFGLGDGPANMTEILTVRPFVRAMKDDAGTCSIAPNVKSSGTKGTVDSQPVTTAFAYYDSNVPNDPDTGVPWTPSGFNAAEHVVERTA